MSGWPGFNVTGNPFLEAAVLSTMPPRYGYRRKLTRRRYVAKRRFARRTTARRTFRRTRRYTRRRRTGFARRRPRRRTTLRRRVAQLSRLARNGVAFHRHKWNSFNRLAAVENQVIYQHSVLSIANLETAMANLRYYDPSTPGTLTTAAAGTGTYNRTIHVNSIYHKISIRNNSLGPCTARVYFICPRRETNAVPTQAITDGIADQVVTGGVTIGTGVQLYPTDITAFTAEWKVLMTKQFRLVPGSSVSTKYATGQFDYNPALADTETHAYQKRFHNCGWLLRIEGPTAEDSAVGSEEGIGPARVDVRVDRIFKFTYDAGVNLNDISLSNNADTFTNQPTVAMRPQAVTVNMDNI